MKPAELQILLDISAAISSATNRDDLFRVIVDKINPVFNCSHEAVILTTDKENTHYRMLLSEIDKIPGEVKAFKEQEFEIDPIIRNILNTEGGLIYQTESLIQQYPDLPGPKFVSHLGVKEVMSCRLQTGGKIIGKFSLHSGRINHFKQNQLPLFKAVADLTAVAVSNILANEETALKQYQNTQLLKISTHIATIRDKKDLFKMVAERIKSFVPYDDFVIATVNEESQTFGVLLADMDEATQQHESYKPSITQVHPLVKGTIPYKVYSTEKPFIIDVVYEYEKDRADYFRYAYEFGMKQELVARLVHSGKVIGLLAMLSRNYIYSKADIETLYSLNSLLAIALNNIIANKELELRELHKSQLLKLSSHIATVRDRDDLFHLIAKELKTFVDFDDAVIAMVDEQSQTFRVFLDDTAPSTSNHPDFPMTKSKSFPIKKGGLMDVITGSEKPLVLDIKQMYLNYPELEFIKYAYSFGMREMVITRLVRSEKLIGLFAVLSKQPKHYNKEDVNAVQSLSSLVAIALNNILANQEILDKEQLTQRLYNISTNIANVRDKNDLFHLITEDVKKFIRFDNAIISTIDEKQETFGMFLSDVGIDISRHNEFPQASTKRFPLTKDSIPYRVIHSDKPWTIDIKKEHFKNPEVEFLKFSYNFGMRESLVTKLSHSGKVIGVFVLFSKEANHFTEADIVTLQSLSSLITIALRNILAIEEIENLSKQLELDNTYLNEEIKSNYNFEEVIGVSKPLQEVFKKVTQVAQADSTVLITGETGTGKELIARAIHNLSSRKTRPLIKVNCAALPATLIESELFGHEKGSFTGATDKRIGKFELANGSTIFLDEVGELPLELQAKLLRAIQEKEIERLGGDKVINVDVRIITATNRNLEKEVSAGKFRQDLFYRLNVYPIELPALRDRKEDIPLLAAHFIQKFSKKLGKKISGMTPPVLEELVTNNWPGNIRELEHTIERSMLLTSGKIIDSLNLQKNNLLDIPITAKAGFEPKTLADTEKELIVQTLKHTNGRIRGKGCAAELLHILPTTLEARMKKLGIKKEFVKE